MQSARGLVRSKGAREVSVPWRSSIHPKGSRCVGSIAENWNNLVEGLFAYSSSQGLVLLEPWVPSFHLD